MSLKTAPDVHARIGNEHRAGRAPGTAGSRPRQPWSLAVRLAVGYAASAFALLLASSAYAYWSLANGLEHEDINFLAEEVYEVRILLGSKPDGTAALREFLDRESEAHLASPLYIRVVDGHDGGASRPIVAESRGMDVVLPLSDFPASADISSTVAGNGRADSSRVARASMAKLTARDGAPLYATTAAIAVDGRPYTVQIAVDRSFEDRLLGSYRFSMFVVLLLGLFACALTGYLIARRGLRPLQRMAAVVQRVGSSTLDQRVADDAYPAELSSLAATFDAMLGRLEDAFARLSRFSADIAHELRTPIHNMRGMLEVTVVQPVSPGDDRHRLLAPCLEECQRLSRLIDNLLFLARAENPHTQIERRSVDVTRELSRVAGFYEAPAAEAGVQIELADAPAGSATGELDRVLLQRALCNLVENALYHTPSGGRISLAATRESNLVRIEVADTGRGIPSEHLLRLFDRFHRVDPSRSKHTGGVGLGLAIVKSIATLHGGTVAVDSSPGAGSRFVLTLPVAAAAAAFPAASAHSAH
jgi:two-component system heavy metal sensor histidine kinase CusS